MIQQINLYQFEEPIESRVFSFVQTMQVATMLIIVLIFISGYKFISYYHTRTELSTLQNKQRSLNLELTKIQDKIPTKEEKEKLTQQIERLKETTANMKKTQLALKQLQTEYSSGFSEYLAALAKYDVPELWLTAIKLSSGGRLIHLEGKATEAEYVPHLLQKLGAEAVFAGKTFETFKLYTENKEKLIKFSIGSN